MVLYSDLRLEWSCTAQKNCKICKSVSFSSKDTLYNTDNECAYECFLTCSKKKKKKGPQFCHLQHKILRMHVFGCYVRTAAAMHETNTELGK